ncbi:MAG: M13 family metallopeptidase [Thermoanaerobaculia bacterium]
MPKTTDRSPLAGLLLLGALGVAASASGQAAQPQVAPTALGAVASSAPALAETAAEAETSAGMGSENVGGLQPLTALPYTPSLEPAFMDRSIDPCVDFYAYSCNGWRALNPIPPDKSRWAVYGKLYNENQRYLWGLLVEAAANPSTEDAGMRQLGDAFAACMDLAAIDKAALNPIRADMAEIGRLKDGAALAPLLAKLQLESQGRGLLFDFGSEQDPGDAAQRIAVVQAGGLGLPDRDYYLKTDAASVELRKQYVAHTARNFRLMGEAEDWAAESAAIVLAIETDLAKASLSRVDRRDPHKVYHRMNLATLQKLTPAFPWKEYFAASGVAAGSAGFVVDVNEPEFLKAVQKVLAERPIANLRTYLRWALLRSTAQDLSAPYREADFDFYSKTLRGIPEPPPRWQTCVDTIDRDLGEALGKVFVDRQFSPATRASADAMVRGIHEAMGERVKALDWMSEATKAKALEKLASMRYKIGAPEVYRDYSSIAIDRKDFFANVRRATEFEGRRRLAQIGKPIDRGEWEMTPPTVNAYYNASMNDMNFPAGVLLPPLFDPKLDDAPNYGNTGGTIGHELTHGFDDEGRQFDAAGNLKDWWTKEDAAKFVERAQCVVDQYAKYPVVDEVKINSKLTLGEDVADLGGAILAWEAWKKAQAGKSLESRDGLSPEQRFFVGFAQWVCENQRPEELRLQAATNPHSPGVWRINGVVVNMPEFAEAFSCKPGQPMVSEKVCRIW